MSKASDGRADSSEAALREYLDALVQANKGKPIRDATIQGCNYKARLLSAGLVGSKNR
jgi:hypothetical protein